jgi:hypothetical protein
MTDANASVVTNAAAAPAADANAAVAQNATVVTDGNKPAQDGKADEGKGGAPEKYGDFKLPEGVEVDKAMLEGFLPVAKELNLSQEQAQKLVDFQSQYVAHAAKAQQEAWDTMQADWVKAAKADKDIGGPAFNDSVGFAAKAIKQFGTAELKAALDATGVGNHPEFIRVFAKIGKAMSEDKFHVSNAEAPATPQSLAQRLFPNQGTN